MAPPPPPRGEGIGLRRASALRALADRLSRAGANLTLVAPGLEPLETGRAPARARVVFHDEKALDPLLRGDHLRLAEAYLAGRIDVHGDLLEVMKVTDLLEMDASTLEKLGFAVRLRLSSRRRWNRRSISFHYDRPPEFFLAWLDRSRSYSHGFYRFPDEAPEEAQARKMQYALDALRLKPGMWILDMGTGWGGFLEYAGRRGISVHGITLSTEQFRFVERSIRDSRLPCTVELVDFCDYRPRAPLDGAVFMGTLEHVPDYGRVARFLAEHLKPEARFYADFLSSREARLFGAFLSKHIFPGTASYVDLTKLVEALGRHGFNILELADDTESYACTVRDWADALESAREELARRFGEATVRTFLLYLRGSQHFFSRNRTQAHHLVGGRESAPLEEDLRARGTWRTSSATATLPAHANAKASPRRA